MNISKKTMQAELKDDINRFGITLFDLLHQASSKFYCNFRYVRYLIFKNIFELYFLLLSSARILNYDK